MMTKLPPVRRLLSDAGAAAKRFPEAVICGLVAATAGATGIDAADERFWFRIFFAAALGLPLFTTLVLAAERRGWPEAWRWTARTAGAALLVLWWAASDGWQMNIIPVRFVHTAITLHLAAAALPYLGAKEPWGFWQYNRALLFRFVMGVVYAAAVFVGIALAVLALDNLFNVNVPEETYGRLWFAAAFGLHPLVFLAGVPADFASLNESREYPKWLRIFSQNVMLPLVGLYVAILTTYLAKILITGTWPSGWVSYLVSALAVIGVFSLLMVHPERMRTEKNWIDRYALGFWIAILYSAVMVMAALWQRIDQYGITEARYLLGAMAVWLAATALHRVITRTRDIKTIPTTLAVLGALTVAGPWSAYAVAKRSQLNRIEEILTTHGALAEDELSADPREIPFDEWQQVEDVTLYLVDNHGTAAFDRWAGGVGTSTTDEPWATEPAINRDGLYDRIDDVITRLGVRPGPSGRPVELLAATPREPISTEGWDLMATIGGAGEATIDGNTLRFDLSDDGLALIATIGDRESRTSLAPLIQRAQAARDDQTDDASRPSTDGTAHVDAPANEMVLDFAAEGLSMRVAVGWLRVEELEAGTVATDLTVDAVLLRRTPPSG